MIGGEKLDIVAVEGIGTVEGGHHAFGVEPGQAVELPILGLEQIAAVAEVFHAQAYIFHEVGGEGLEGGVGIACLDLFAEDFARAGLVGVAGKQAEVSILQFFAKCGTGLGNFGDEGLEGMLIELFAELVELFPNLWERMRAVGTGVLKIPTP